MEKLVTDWLSGQPEFWQIVVGLITLIALLVQRLANIRETWINYRKGLSGLIFEKHRLEVLKLKYEIEAIKKTHGSLAIDEPIAAEEQDIEEDVKVSAQTAPAEEALIAKSGQPTSLIWSWFIKHPVIGHIIIGFSQIMVGFYLFAFAMGAMIMPFMGYIDPAFQETPWTIAITWLIYVALTYACYRGYVKLKNRRALLHTSTPGSP